MAHGFLSLVSLTVLLLAGSGFCRFVSKDQPYNSTIEPSPKAAVLAEECSFIPNTTNLSSGDYADFSTPNYPENYPIFHACTWKFQAGPNAKLSVNCPVVHLNWFGVLYVKDGDNTMRESCWEDCSPKSFQHSFTDAIAVIGLHNTLSFQAKGFKCRITAKPKTGEVTSTTKSTTTTTQPTTTTTKSTTTTTKSTTTTTKSTTTTTQPTTTTTKSTTTTTKSTTTTTQPTTTTTKPSISTLPPSHICTCGVPVRSTRIIGGQETEQHEYPWMASLILSVSGTHFCGGSLISNKFVLTARHCTKGETVASFKVLLGHHFVNSANRPSSSLYLTPVRMINHDEYTEHFFGEITHDIALVEIPVIDFSEVGPTIRPICLPSGSSDYAGDTATATGWGCEVEQSSASSLHLKETDVKVIENTECKEKLPILFFFHSHIDSTNICTDNIGTLTCKGDSGGPLFTNSSNGKYVEQIGITSWGRYDAGATKFPDVFARVTELMPWIIANTTGSVTCAPPS